MSVAKDDSFIVKLSSETSEERGILDRAFLTWKIANFLSRAENADEELLSPEFWCSGTLWRLSLYPYGQSSRLSVGVVVFYLHKVHSSDGNHRAFFQFRIPLKGGVETHKCYEINEIFRGSDKSCGGMVPRNTISIKSHGFLPGGVLTVFCDVALKTNASSTTETAIPRVDDAQTEDYGNLATLSTDFETLYENPTFADVRLKLGDQELPAHKLVLRSRSKTFSAMLECDTTQKHQQDTIDISEMEVVTVKDMLRYIYCGKVRQLTSEEALKLYVAAGRYELPGLASICRRVLLNHLSTDNFCEITVVANFHNDQLLIDSIKPLISNNMKEVLKSDKWKTFSKENPVLSLNLIETVLLNE